MSRCLAVTEDKQCRSTKNLTRVEIGSGGSLRLPERMVVELCPKHFHVPQSLKPAK